MMLRALSIGCVVTIASVARAEDITTAQMGDAISHLVKDATCAEVLEVVRSHGMASPDDAAMMLALVAYAYGHAAGAGVERDQAMEEILIGCFNNPDRLFAGFTD